MHVYVISGTINIPISIALAALAMYSTKRLEVIQNSSNNT